MNYNKTVVVAMSGGVDSSVAAALLKDRGYNVIGVTMHLWDFKCVGRNIYSERACCSPKAMADARAVCQKLGIPHYLLDLRKDFQRWVIQNFIDEYLRGRTPNPCVLCNTKIKWESLLKKAQKLGADHLATGHYTRVRYDPQRRRYLLLKGVDPSKDQSYALWGLTQESLERTILPLGDLTKEKVREIARDLGLKTAEKNESQEICFIPDHDYPRFLRERIKGIEKGEILTQDGRVVGFHEGYPFYTIGQRRGLRVALGEPVYVTRIDPTENRIYVGTRDQLLGDELIAGELNWIAIEKLEGPLKVFAKIRYKDPGGEAEIFPLNDNKVRVKFKKPQRAITPGQSVVFYDGDCVVGGGIIERQIRG